MNVSGLTSAILVVFLMSLFVRITSKNKKKDEMRQNAKPNRKYSGRNLRDEDTVPYGGDTAPRQSLNEKIANSAVGIKYIEGETVPEGNGIAKCAYCGAENLIVKNYRGRYICYFCREFL